MSIIPVEPASNPLPIRKGLFWTRPLPARLLLPAVRIAGGAFAACSLLGLVVAILGGGAEWLGAAGGLGAVALGAQQAAAGIRDTEAKRRKVRSLARLIRRSLVESCRLNESALNLRTWLEQIGNERTLDTLQNQFRELQGLGAELGDEMLSDAADLAFEKFLRSADLINPLFVRRELLPPDAETLADRAGILARTIAAIDALASIAPPADDEPDIHPNTRTFVEGILLLYGEGEDDAAE